MAEYDHMAELGLTADKQFVCCDFGFISRTNCIRELCARFIRNGDKLYDVINRYESVTSYALSREGQGAALAIRTLIPFLKAFGITDALTYSYCNQFMDTLPGSKDALTYITSQMPTFMTTDSFEHYVMNLSDNTEFPLMNISFNSLSFDAMELSRPDAKKLREIANKLTNMRVSDECYTVSNNKYLNPLDSKIVDEMDDVISKEMERLELTETLKKMTLIGGNEKAYAVLELCRKNDIEMSDTVMVGSSNNDFQAMDLVRDSEGLAIAFNGSEYAIRGSNVAILDSRPITAALLATEFYNGGIETVYNMIENWDRKSLEEMCVADRHLLNKFFEEHPKKLPIVFKVDDNNIDEIVMTSAEYRGRLLS